MIVIGKKNKIKNSLNDRFGERCLFSEELKYYTSYRIGGNAEFLVLPATVLEWRFLFNFCNSNNLNLNILGAGTNVLVSDEGVKGITASTALMKEIRIDGNTITVKSGNLLDNLVSASTEKGLAGIENLSGIPGTVGGAVFMNAGAYGQEIFDSLIEFQVLDFTGEVKIIKKQDTKYGYRKVEGLENSLILSAVFKLKKYDAKQLKNTRSETLKKRAEKQPLEYPSAGSVFKRPSHNFASKLIDEAGLKGRSIGGAEISKKHAGFIINKKNASAKDVYKLINLIKDTVKEKSNITLELEQKLLGNF